MKFFGSQSFLFILVLSLSIPVTETPGQEPGEAIVFYTITAPKGYKPKLLWVRYDNENQKMVSRKGKDKKVDTLKGDTITLVKGKEFETRYYALKLLPGTYVLHSIGSKASLTSFFPTTPGFTAQAGDVLFLGDFNARQLHNTYRGLVDKRTGLSLVFNHNDPAGFTPSARDMKAKGLLGLPAMMTPVQLFYYAVEDYTRETQDAE